MPRETVQRFMTVGPVVIGSDRSRLKLGEYGMADRVHEVNFAAARLAPHEDPLKIGSRGQVFMVQPGAETQRTATIAAGCLGSRNGTILHSRRTGGRTGRMEAAG